MIARRYSYRDTLALLLPFASKHRGRAIDRMTVEDLTPVVVRKFLEHLENERQCSGVTPGLFNAVVLPSLSPPCNT